MHEPLLPLADAIERVIGERRSYPTCFRWTQRGLLGTDGRRRRLGFVKCGSKRKTSEAEVRRFLKRLSGDGTGTTSELSTNRAKAIADAEAKLDAKGVLLPKS